MIKMRFYYKSITFITDFDVWKTYYKHLALAKPSNF